MKRALFIAASIALSLYINSAFGQGNGRNVSLPYFGNIRAKLLCGDVCGSCYCQPKTSSKWAKVGSGGKPYNEDPSSALGILFRKYFDGGSDCSGYAVTANDIDTPKKQDFKAQIVTNKKAEFDIKLQGDITGLIRQYVKSLPNELTVKLEAALQGKVQRATATTLTMEYRVYELDPNFRKRNVQLCLGNAKDGEKYATGIATIGVKGSFTDNLVKSILAEIEATAEYLQLEGSVRAKYQAEKEQLLTATFEGFPVIFAVSYPEANN